MMRLPPPSNTRSEGGGDLATNVSQVEASHRSGRTISWPNTMHSMRTVLGPSCGPDRLEDAFRARSSVPVVLAPMQDGERVLVDGDVLDPVPAKTVRNIGADLCLAINVVTPPRTGVQIMLSRSTGSSTH